MESKLEERDNPVAWASYLSMYNCSWHEESTNVLPAMVSIL